MLYKNGDALNMRRSFLQMIAISWHFLTVPDNFQYIFYDFRVFNFFCVFCFLYNSLLRCCVIV